MAATLVQGETSLTEDMLTRTMPHPAKRVDLEMEARAGEHKVATHDIDSAKQLQALLGKPGKKGEIVKFPWHPKRMTTTPNHGLRWVRRASTWRLAE